MAADLTEEDYDALYVVVKEEMPRITRYNLPGVLAQLLREGVITITLTETDITVRMPGVPETRVERKRRLH